jgi:hypothetical protein
MQSEITKTLDRVEKRIYQCEILSQLLSDRINMKDIDYERYTRHKYTQEEVVIGLELINIYITLKEYSKTAKQKESFTQ